MIDYATYCRIKQMHEDGLRISQIAAGMSAQLSMKASIDTVCFYHNSNLVARHPRSYDRNQDFEHPDHPRALLVLRKKAREQRLLMRFLTLSPKAEAYHEELARRRMNPRHHIRQIVALGEVYGTDMLTRAIEDAFTYQAFSCEYIANILEQRRCILPEAGALHVTCRQDLLELDIPESNLSTYDIGDNDDENCPQKRVDD